jgi:hypothetical protein
MPEQTKSQPTIDEKLGFRVKDLQDLAAASIDEGNSQFRQHVQRVIAKADKNSNGNLEISEADALAAKADEIGRTPQPGSLEQQRENLAILGAATVVVGAYKRAADGALRDSDTAPTDTPELEI